jgi:lysozyme
LDLIKGVDVSAYQGVLGWKALADSGIKFAYVKCCEGMGAVDPRYAANVAGARAAGIAVGAYFFVHPNGDPIAQAQHHFEISQGLGTLAGDLPPACDLETPVPQDWVKQGATAASLRGWALAYLAATTTRFGVEPLLYSFPSFLAAMEPSTAPEFAKYRLWLAYYPRPYSWPATTDVAPVPAPWTKVTVWQFSGGTMKAPGGPPIDYDVIQNDEDLAALLARTGLAGSIAQVAIEEAADGDSLHDDTPPAAS